jgi:hypothetical protein
MYPEMGAPVFAASMTTWTGFDSAEATGTKNKAASESRANCVKRFLSANGMVRILFRRLV